LTGFAEQPLVTPSKITALDIFRQNASKLLGNAAYAQFAALLKVMLGSKKIFFGFLL